MLELSKAFVPPSMKEGRVMANTRFFGWQSLVGCAVLFALLAGAPTLASAQSVDEAVTFTKDIAPIFQQKCEACHREGSMAPMSLVSFPETRPWARSIKAAVAAREMPPWHLDKTVGIQEFKNDRSLSDDQINTIVRWVDSGAPMGAPAGVPPLLQY